MGSVFMALIFKTQLHNMDVIVLANTLHALDPVLSDRGTVAL